jgi:hypothetical protein
MQRGASAVQSNHTAAEPRAEPTVAPACFLSAHAYVCEFDDGAIVLDLRGDTYVGIDAHHLSNLRMRIGNWPDSGRSDHETQHHDFSESENLIAGLLARGILTVLPTTRQPSPAASPTMALATAMSTQTRRRIPLAHVARFSVAYLEVVWRLRRNRLEALSNWLRRRQSSIHRKHLITQQDTMGRLASFLWLRTWCYSARQRCLFDSLVLSVYLTRGMVPCTFVIGVSTRPFMAHSWVQIGESVLNDTAEHVQDFKPILSIGGE